MTETEQGRPRELFALVVDYVAPLAEVDALMEDHRRFLERFYTDGTFVMSGRQVPRQGGFILAACEDRARMEAVIAQDPFVRGGVAEYRVVQVQPTKAGRLMQPVLDELLAPAARCGAGFATPPTG
jgi:uncharacterized protein YciI